MKIIFSWVKLKIKFLSSSFQWVFNVLNIPVIYSNFLFGSYLKVDIPTTSRVCEQISQYNGHNSVRVVSSLYLSARNALEIDGVSRWIPFSPSSSSLRSHLIRFTRFTCGCVFIFTSVSPKKLRQFLFHRIDLYCFGFLLCVIIQLFLFFPCS